MRVALSSAPWIVGAVVATIAGPASAGCSAACSSCCLPTTHTVTVPGVTVAPPVVSIAPPSVSIAGGVGASSLDVSVATSVESSSNAQAYAQSMSSVAASGSAGAVSSGAVANLVSGGGGMYVDAGGPSTSFGPINVETPQVGPIPSVCVEWRSATRLIALQASCLDDKAVPHPASQVAPERDVAASYEGEVFRCIAGSHMQFTTGDWNGAAHFEGGRTVVCRKGDALWRGAAGDLACRPQRPARDCNERSLLRRYGAGVKVVAASTRTCVQSSAVRGIAQQDATSLTPGFAGEGGVGR